MKVLLYLGSRQVLRHKLARFGLGQVLSLAPSVSAADSRN